MKKEIKKSTYIYIIIIIIIVVVIKLCVQDSFLECAMPAKKWFLFLFGCIYILSGSPHLMLESRIQNYAGSSAVAFL